MQSERKCGSVSVLMMILLSSLIIVFFVLYDNASFHTMQSAVLWNGENAGSAVLSYYLPELKERYDLYGIWKEASVLEWRMQYFVENNSPFWNEGENPALFKAECETIHADPSEYLLLDPLVLKEQINDIMEQGMLVDFIQKNNWLSQWAEVLKWVGTGLDMKNTQEQSQIQRAVQTLEDDGEQERLKEKREELERKAAQKEKQGEVAMNEIVLEEGRELTDPFRIASLPSKQKSSSGIQDSWTLLKQNPDQLVESIRSSMATDLYALHYFGNYTDQREGEFLCQVEYILHGELSDAENLEKTKRDLFLLRTGLNLVSIYQNDALNQWIASLAAAAAPVPYPVAFGLLASAVSAAEAGEDVKSLMNGGTIPVLKSADDWLSADKEQSITEVVTGSETEIDLELTYEQYLHVLLVLMSQEIKILRMMDLIQLDLQKSFGDCFTLEEICCGYQWKIQAVLKNSMGKERVWICEGKSRYGT